MEELVKICPSCQAEYLPHIERCADCGTVLVLPGQPCEAPSPATAHPPRDISDLVCVRTADLEWAKRLAARLERAGIDHLLEAEESQGARCCGAGRFRVLVRQEDAEAASRVDAEHYLEFVPGLERAPAAEQNPGACPACGEPAPESAAECPSCGLALAPAAEGCPGCGAPLPPAANYCPNCGRSTGRGCC